MAIQPTVWYVRDNAASNTNGGGTVGWSTVTQWATSTAKTVGNLVRQKNATPAVNSERVFVCIVAGTTSATTEPTWVTNTRGAKTNDTAPLVWQDCTGHPGVNGDTDNCPVWAGGTSVSLGDLILVSSNSSLQICTTAGTTSGSIPAFSATAGVITSDGANVKWTSLGLASGFGKFAAPFARVNAVASNTGWAVTGDTIFVSDDHSELTTAAVTIGQQSTTAIPSYIVAIDHTGMLGFACTVMATPSAIINSSTALADTTNGAVRIGLDYVSAGQVTIQHIGFGHYENGNFQSTGSNVRLNGSYTEWYNCTLATASSFNNQAQGVFKWVGGAQTATWIPIAISASGSVNILEGLDFSSQANVTVFANTINTNAFSFQVNNCKPSTGTFTLMAQPFAQGSPVYGAAITSPYSVNIVGYQGTVTDESGPVRTATTDVGPINLLYTTNTNSSFFSPLDGPESSIYNTTTGSTVNVTMFGLINAAALPNNDDIYMDVKYLGTSSSVLLTKASTRKATKYAVPAAVSSDTSNWQTGVAARLNSHAYSGGAIIATTGNATNVFFCTVGGTSASSEPAGYASAGDGTLVTDGTATFRAATRFKFSVAVTPQVAGNMYAQVRAIKNSATYYIDPVPVLS